MLMFMCFFLVMLPCCPCGMGISVQLDTQFKLYTLQPPLGIKMCSGILRVDNFCSEKHYMSIEKSYCSYCVYYPLIFFNTMPCTRVHPSIESLFCNALQSLFNVSHVPVALLLKLDLLCSESLFNKDSKH